MKELFIFAVLFSFLCTGCSGAARFTSKESPATETEEVKSDEPPSGKTENIRQPADGTVLETTTGVASFYGKKFNGRETANGETYNMNELTAAHSSYPFNTVVKITNLLNNKSVVVRINDRKPDFHGRIIDVSYAAAKQLDMLVKGITKVQVDVLSWGEK